MKYEYVVDGKKYIGTRLRLGHPWIWLGKKNQKHENLNIFQNFLKLEPIPWTLKGHPERLLPGNTVCQTKIKHQNINISKQFFFLFSKFFRLMFTTIQKIRTKLVYKPEFITLHRLVGMWLPFSFSYLDIELLKCLIIFPKLVLT